jgi:hypothetical protein
VPERILRKIAKGDGLTLLLWEFFWQFTLQQNLMPALGEQIYRVPPATRFLLAAPS